MVVFSLTRPPDWSLFSLSTFLNWEEQACVHGGSDTIGESVDLRFNIPTVHA